MLGGKPRFVHVLRDGRDVALGDLRLVTSLMCAAYFTHTRRGHHDGGSPSGSQSFAQRFDVARGHLLQQAQGTSLGRACSASGRAPQLVAWALLNAAIADEAKRRYPVCTPCMND